MQKSISAGSIYINEQLFHQCAQLSYINYLHVNRAVIHPHERNTETGSGKKG